MNCDGNLIFLRAVIFTMNNLHTMSTFIFYVLNLVPLYKIFFSNCIFSTQLTCWDSKLCVQFHKNFSIMMSIIG